MSHICVTQTAFVVAFEGERGEVQVCEHLFFGSSNSMVVAVSIVPLVYQRNKVLNSPKQEQKPRRLAVMDIDRTDDCLSKFHAE